MTCRGCGKHYEDGLAKCPQCGRSSGSGLFQTSSVLISAHDAEGIYRSVEEVPPPLRSRLLQSTNGVNSATILIADRRGREEIARAVRSAAPRRGFAGLLVSREPAKTGFRLTGWGKAAVAGLLVALASLLVRQVLPR